MKTRLFLSILGVIAFLFVTGSAAASAQYAALGSGFTYQGRLTDGGGPANGIYDFQFSLYDDASAGSQVGSTLQQDDVTVADGLFTVQLDFGNVFDGTALWLEIGVRAGSSTGAYSTLTPRQPLTATPYALYAKQAAIAPWSGISGMPAGFADGVDNGAAYKNVVIVAKSGGEYTSIQAALDSITDASESNPYLVWVAPGVYTELVTMKAYVDIEGSGELTTKITFVGWTTATVQAASNAELRFLTVESTGGGSDSAIAIDANYASPRLTHVTALASGGNIETAGVRIGDFASPTMTDVTAKASGGAYAYGVEVLDFGNGATTIQNSVISASGGTSGNTGIRNGAFAPPGGVFVNNSKITGSTTPIATTMGYTRVAASQLSGGPVSSVLTRCAGVYDEDYVFYASSCP